MIFKYCLYFISILSLSLMTMSAKAQVKSATVFFGECTRKVGDVEDHNYCDNNIVNLNFNDGYVSFQFNSKEKLNNGRYKDSISFVGPGIAKQQDNGKVIIYLPVEQLTFADGRNNKLDTKKVDNSVCLLGFSNGNPKQENLRYLQCNYNEDNKIIMYSAKNIKIHPSAKNDNYRGHEPALDLDFSSFKKITCNDFGSIFKSEKPELAPNSIMEKVKDLRFSGTGPLYLAGAISCECKKHLADNLKSAIENIYNIHKLQKKYNVPYNIKISGFLSDLADRHSADWRKNFHNWISERGPMPAEDTDGNPTCAIIHQ
jgi:hypothetical protein